MTKRTLTYDKFLEIRKDVIDSWHTGKEAENLKSGITYQKKQSDDKNFSIAMKNAHDQKEILLQPRAGVALLAEHIKLLQYLETEGHADLLPTTIDAYTRQNRYEEAQIGIEKSKQTGNSSLNGFPAVNYGITGCREVIENTNKPVQVRHGTPDARLLAEISLASGFTSFEGGGISYNIPYTKNVTLEKSIKDWQYVDYLTGLYEKEGIRINREPFGPLTGTLVPPCISNSVAVIEGLLALEQGVTSLTLGYGQSGNIKQDVAAIISLRILANKFFKNHGYESYELTTVFHQWMGGFPNDEAKAFAVISWGTVAGTYAEVDKIIVKTPHEAMGIPTREANAEGLKNSRQIIYMVKDQNPTEGAHLRKEVDIIVEETSAIVNKVFELGEGNLAQGVSRAFNAGVIDIPFAPSVHNRGKVLPIRDDEGIIRMFNTGSVPIPQSIKDFYQERINTRAKNEGRKASFQMVTDDIYAISKGNLIGRPR